MTATPQLMLNRKWYQASKPEMEFHMIDMMYVALPKDKIVMQRRLYIDNAHMAQNKFCTQLA